MIKINAPINHSPKTDAVFLFLAMPALVTGLLPPLALVTHTILPVSDYPIYEIGIAAGHVVALVLAAAILRRSFNRVDKPYIPIPLIVTICVQMVWRTLSVGVTHLDCADSCDPSIVPQSVDQTASIVTLFALIITATILFIYFYRKKSSLTPQ